MGLQKLKDIRNFSVSLLLLVVYLQTVQAEKKFVKRPRRFTPREYGPISEHGKLCNASFSPNLREPLQECNTAKNCTEIGFECIDGSYCCPTKENVCTSAEDSGRERMQDEHFGRYAYSAQLKTCVKFSYFGNEGNFNNFLKHRDCMHYCHSQAN